MNYNSQFRPFGNQEAPDTLRIKVLKLLPLLAILGGIFLLAINHSAIAAPPDIPAEAMGHTVKKAGVTLEKQASAQTVSLGQVVTYTVIIKNESGKTIQATLSDVLPLLPEGLALQKTSITATSGTFDGENNSLTWTGDVTSGEEVKLVYEAIPPSTSTAGQSLENVATLQFGETTLQAAATITTQPPDYGGGFWAIWGSFINFIAIALVFFDRTLRAVSIPYSFGFAIILFTLIVRGATFPLNMQQIKSSKAMQDLQPQLKALQEKYKNDREKLAQEQMALYKEHGVNPLGGCLPMIVQMPIWFALYRSLIQLANEGLLSEGFFWIPSLAGPSIYGGLGWLWPLPPSIGWLDALAYLVMPVLLVVSQLYMQKLMTPASSDPSQAQVQKIMQFMPLMFGYISLIVPSGLTLYWFTSNTLGVAQHYFTRTQLNKPEPVGKKITSSPSSTPIPATDPASTDMVSIENLEESSKSKKRKHAKSKRKSKRKR